MHMPHRLDLASEPCCPAPRYDQTQRGYGTGLVYGPDCPQTPSPSPFHSQSPTIPDLVAAPVGLGPMRCMVQVLEWLEQAQCAVQSGWSGSCTACGSYPGWTVLHIAPAPGHVLYMVLTPAGPGPMLYMVLAGAICSMGPGLAGAGTKCSTIPELPGWTVHTV